MYRRTKNSIFNRLDQIFVLVVNRVDYYNTISFYENLIINQCFENEKTVQIIINRLTIEIILLIMVNSARQYKKIIC